MQKEEEICVIFLFFFQPLFRSTFALANQTLRI